MSQNIFDATLDPNNDVKVNNFDWSHANNLTTQIGRITPIFCDMVPSKTSFRVNPRFGLQFMPMVFPIQTRMKARVMWFRYPLRALWKDYKDFVGNFREGLEEPYIDFNTEERLRKMASTGSLGDYLGLPTTLVGSYGSVLDLEFLPSMMVITGNKFNGSSDFVNYPYIPIHSVSDVLGWLKQGGSNGFQGDVSLSLNFSSPATSSSSVINKAVPCYLFEGNLGTVGFSITATSVFKFKLMVDPSKVNSRNYINYVTSAFCCAYDAPEPSSAWDFSLSGIFNNEDPVNPFIEFTAVVGEDFASWYKQSSSDTLTFLLGFNAFSSVARRISGNDTAWNIQSNNLSAYSSLPTGVVTSGFTIENTAFKSLSAQFMLSDIKPQELTLSTSPWYNSTSPNKNKQQKILAYGFRAYEGIYNSFIRDNRNNPYYLNGRVQYNKWIPNDEGGVDNELYELRYANWEKDFLTTAVQSPQQGNAPLVGITTYTQTVANEDGTNTELIKTALVDEDGKKYGLSFKTSDDGLEGVEYIELDNGTQMRQARSLYDLATSGISIPDLRMVNCYQKFLELNMRKGYSYKDIVEGRFDVKVRYADLLMPEFFGGVSRDIDVNSVTQTVDQNIGKENPTYAEALGSQSGIAGVRGEANVNIECFCDEESIIMGLLIVTPLPVYTQLLPKHFTYRGLMEHFQPEFNLIGFQPIKYNEVCPIQAYNDNPDTLTETFGYNRPWYEFAQKYDVAHGLFRTDLSNFLMHRVFNKKPELAQSFLLVDPEQVTDVFAVTETTDKIYGQIWLDITCKLPIARVAIPRLD